MKTPLDDDIDELPTNLDFENLEGGVRGKYTARFRAGTNVVFLEPDLVKHFPDSNAVNTALRKLLSTASSEGGPEV